MKKNRLVFFILFFVQFILFSQDEKEYEQLKLQLNREKDLTVKNYSPLVNADIAMSTPGYLVTAGDVYSLVYAMGGKIVNVNLIVDISYNVKILNLATINVNGLTFSQFKRQVEDIIRNNYPLSGAQLIMVKPSVFTVMIKGEVLKAVEVQASALTRLSNVIQSSLTEYSSTRNIEIVSMNGKKRSYDLFTAHRNGDFSQDPFLRPGDTIIINRFDRKVTIVGSVERPGTYELLKEDTLKELIEIYGGGLKEFADISKLTLMRNNNVPLGKFIKVEKEKINEFQLQNKDIINIPDHIEFKPIITIEFEESFLPIKELAGHEYDRKDMHNTEIIPFTEGSDLVSIVRAYRSKFSKMSDTKNAYLMRNGEKIYTNFNRIFYDIDYNEKILLEAGDMIIIPAILQTVTVSGAVTRPGAYPYVPGKTYEYYIAVAGGFINQQNAFSSVKIRDASGKKMNKKDYILPDSIITANSNAFLYNVMPYVTFVASVLGIIATTVGLVFTLRGK